VSDESSSGSPQPENPSKEFVGLLTASHNQLLGYLMTLLGRYEDAKDVLQVASMTMWDKFSDFESGTNFLAWARKICIYEVRNFQRTSARSPLQFDPDLLETLSEERGSDLEHQDSRHQALRGCMQKLKKADQELVRIHYHEEVRPEQLAEQMGRAKQTVYNRLTTVRRLLADCVRRQLAEEGL